MSLYPPPPNDGLNTIEHMRDTVFFDAPHRGRRIARFWILLLLSAVIASAGIVGDSTATVIGAMIVAPMMMPIQGTMLATVLGDRSNLVRSLAMMIAGALSAIAIGYLVGLVVVPPMTAATNSQVAARATPGLIDLIAALATGAVGSIALVRKDISDTLPGVAIAISLVPPLAVVGVAAESGDWASALGSGILFVANVAAILATGVVVMALFRVQRWGEGLASTPRVKVLSRRRSNIVIAIMLAIVVVPLAVSSVVSTRFAVVEGEVDSVARSWADDHGLDILTVQREGTMTLVRVSGSTSPPDTADLVTMLEGAGVDPSSVEVEFIPSVRTKLG